jgi:hypothetical protein
MENKETLEETAEKFLIRELNLTKIQAETLYSDYIKAVVKFHKWQQEQDKNKYSEEEVLVKLYECLGHFAYQHNIVINGNEIDKWFEQFKKK